MAVIQFESVYLAVHFIDVGQGDAILIQNMAVTIMDKTRDMCK